MKSATVTQLAQRPAKAASVGAAVLAGLKKGRDRINQERKAQSAQRVGTIAYLALADRDAGHPAWGRAGRISRKLQGQMSERLVRKYLARLLSGADLGAYRYGNLIGGPHGEHSPL